MVLVLSYKIPASNFCRYLITQQGTGEQGAVAEQPDFGGKVPSRVEGSGVRGGEGQREQLHHRLQHGGTVVRDEIHRLFRTGTVHVARTCINMRVSFFCEFVHEVRPFS